MQKGRSEGLASHAKFPSMNKPPFPSFPPLPKSFQDFQSKVSEAFKASPVSEIERQMKGAFTTALGKMDIVTRDDFEVQQQMLARALEKLAALEQRLAELEASAVAKKKT